MIWLWIYLAGFLFTWVAAYGLIYKLNVEDDLFGPVENILFSGVLSMIAAMFWPIIIVIFGIHRIATKNIGGKSGGTTT